MDSITLALGSMVFFGINAILYKTAPGIDDGVTVLLAMVFLSESLSWVQWVGVALGVIAIILLSNPTII